MRITSININDGSLSINYTPPSSLVVSNKNSLTLLYSENCPYCRKFLPIWEQSKELYGDQYEFVFVDCDKTPDVSSKYTFRGLPTMILANGTKELDRTVGHQSFETFESFIQKDKNKQKVIVLTSLLKKNIFYENLTHNTRSNILNKTIYMTYKKNVPSKVLSRWKTLNKDYTIDFSLDKDCVAFLKHYFNDHVANIFQSIEKGMYKADLWRLCKLYIHGGVYADVDLVPHINIDKLDKDVTFYSCISIDKNSIFQAFMINNSNPKNPLLLHFIISFLCNNPYEYLNGPTHDMYKCLLYNLDNTNIVSEKKYEINTVKIPINIGTSKSTSKEINLFYFPNDIKYKIKLKSKLKSNNSTDRFNFKITNNKLIATRLDKKSGWNTNHDVDICINTKEIIYLFTEKKGNNNSWVTSYVVHNNIKILDSRDLNYYNNKGW